MYTPDKHLQKEVQEHLGWDAQQWAQFVYDSGLAYLGKIIPDYSQVVAQISRNTVFWNWWKYHWQLRDKEFIESIDYDPSPMLDPVEIYKDQHDPRTLATAVYLNGQVLQETYAEMIGKITKQQTEAA